MTGDCRDVLRDLVEPGQFDACVCDPPYDLTGKSRIGRHRLQSTGGFMGHRWDATGVAFDPATWDAVKRALKPGSYLVAFGGTRTWHRMATAIEDAGFEIKDCLCWLYGSGMPKHKSLLKPAWEPVVLAKKRGQGSINRDACRIDAEPGRDMHGKRFIDGQFLGEAAGDAIAHTRTDIGRVPANVILDEVAAVALDEQTGILKSGTINGVYQGFGTKGIYGDGGKSLRQREASEGGASRFFYCAKADDTERNRGLPLGMENDHPTVKPVSLVQWLVRLVARPGQIVLDPFMGSGTTGIACDREGVGFFGIDLSAHYTEIASYRIRGDAPLFADIPA